MSWEARMAAQRKAVEEAEKKQRSIEEARKMAQQDEQRREQEARAQRDKTRIDTIQASEGYAEIQEFTDSAEFRDALESMKASLPRGVKNKGNKSGRSRRSEVQTMDDFSGKIADFVRTIKIIVFDKERQPLFGKDEYSSFNMRFICKNGQAKYEFYLGGRSVSDGDGGREYIEEWHSEDSADAFLDYLAGSIASDRWI